MQIISVSGNLMSEVHLNQIHLDSYSLFTDNIVTLCLSLGNSHYFSICFTSKKLEKWIIFRSKFAFDMIFTSNSIESIATHGCEVPPLLPHMINEAHILSYKGTCRSS